MTGNKILSLLSLSNTRLNTKILIIPLIVIVATFAALGSYLMYSVTINHRVELIKHRATQLESAISIISSTQLPADALFGIESGDNGVADELSSQMKHSGVDQIIIANIKEEIIYPSAQILQFPPVAAAGGTHPVNPFGHPLVGALGGPLG